MDLREIKNILATAEKDIKGDTIAVGLEEKEQRARALEKEMEDSGFWDDKDLAAKKMQELKSLKELCSDWRDLEARVRDAAQLIDLAKEDEGLFQELEKETEEILRKKEKLELILLFSGKFDMNDAILEINSGAGGTEACDWANMLLRMYLRWAERRGYKVQTINILPGEEAGIKSAAISIKGPYAYGNLKAERGVHRLVRISPFDANKRRHTSFASVDVIPEVDEDIDIEIKDEDLRIDVYRSSGPGGQGVNTTDSAVRIVHLPTGIVVTCQNERSQLQNKETAMRVLKAKLYELEEQKRQEELNKETGEKMKIEWGSQIRSYVMHPYSMVKDHRTGVETGNVQAVMDGEIDPFIQAYLKKIHS